MKKILGLVLGLLLFVSPAFAMDVDVAKVHAIQKYVEDVKSTPQLGWVGGLEIKHFDAQGNLIHEEFALNSLADDGESAVLDCFLRATTCPTTFWLRLVDSTNPCSVVDTTTLAGAVGMGEPSGNGYAAQEITRNSSGWVSLALDSGDFMATSSVETFSATGGSWGPVHCAILTNAQTGTTGLLYSYIALSTGRTLAAGESLNVTYRIKMQ